MSAIWSSDHLGQRRNNMRNDVREGSKRPDHQVCSARQCCRWDKGDSSSKNNFRDTPLAFLFTLRNKRDFGHVGGEVDANAIDALTAIRLSDWCMCELVRVCHSVPLEDAKLICDSIAERQLPMTWTVLSRKRILDPTLTYRDQTLLLLYAEVDSAVPCEDLFEWTEHTQRSHFNRDVLSKLHKGRLIEWDRDTDMAILSPTGIREVEVGVLPRVKAAG